MHIRKTVESDAEALSHMMIASWCDTYSSILSNAKLDEICTIWLTPEKFLERSRNIDAVNFVAMHEDVIVGHIFAEFTQASSLHIAYLYVAKDFLRKGIGESLFKCATDKAAKVKSISLGVFNDNLGAVGFYKAQGFVIIGEDKSRNWQVGDPTEIKMEKLL